MYPINIIKYKNKAVLSEEANITIPDINKIYLCK